MTSRSFLAHFEEQADRTPSAIALTFEGRSLSYRELDERANRLARHLTTHGIGESSVIAICGDRSPELMVAVLGTLKAGAGYLPLDANYPSERLAFMLADSRASFLIRQRGLDLVLPEVRPPELEIHEQHPVLSEGDPSRLAPSHTGESIAYAIYTSGSTGTPKGVAMVHRALDNLIEWQLRDLGTRAGVSTLQFAPLSFDVHFQEMFSTWCGGGRLVLVREQSRLEMLELLGLIERERIERLFLPFIALQSLADIAVTHGRIPDSLREVITAGEQLQITRAIVDFFERLPDAQLFNHYGPSETHVVTSLRLTGTPGTWPALPSIGFALPNVVLAVLDPDGAPVPRGAEGELYIGGVALARGYLFREQLTRERFVERAGARYYRTGDLVKELPDGALQFLGRLDGQVKVRGYRIELGEIEVLLSAHAMVKEAAVSVHENGPGDKRLIAYVVLEQGGDVAKLRGFVQERLPDYMLPSSFVALAALPRTPSGKVDKRALPAPTRARPALTVELVAPKNDAERVLSQIWSELLGVDGLGVRDGFFDLGGNSLLALRAVAETQRRLSKALPIVRFFEYPTIAEQAAYLLNPAAFADSSVRRVAQGRSGERAPVAVIGMAGRFPGARSLGELWRNLEGGVDSVTSFSRAELDQVDADERDDPGYVPARGTLAFADRFDAGFFGVSPSEAAVLDPQQRLLLELSWSALEDAGYAPNATRTVVGVYAGVHNNSYYARLVSQSPNAVERLGAFATMLASEKDYVATRIASKLDLTGPALSIHTACSTSLVAIATAVHHLRAGLCDMALAGGAALSVPQQSGHLYQEGGMLSRDGHTRPFDADASGTVFSDGAGMVVLKALDRALADGDSIYAVIRGVGLNNDGGHKASFTAPSVEGQAAVVAMAQEDAGLNARDIQYVEAHGTRDAPRRPHRGRRPDSSLPTRHASDGLLWARLDQEQLRSSHRGGGRCRSDQSSALAQTRSAARHGALSLTESEDQFRGQPFLRGRRQAALAAKRSTAPGRRQLVRRRRNERPCRLGRGARTRAFRPVDRASVAAVVGAYHGRIGTHADGVGRAANGGQGPSFGGCRLHFGAWSRRFHGTLRASESRLGRRERQARKWGRGHLRQRAADPAEDRVSISRARRPIRRYGAQPVRERGPVQSDGRSMR